MDLIHLSVVVCTLNRSALLGKCLESLMKQETSTDKIEVIVVDNGSTDDTATVTKSFGPRFPKLNYIVEPQLGLARARQTGFEASIGKYIAYLDDDAIAAPYWCSAICQTFAEIEQSPGNGVVALGGPIEPIFEISRPPWLTGNLTSLYAIVDLGERLRPYPNKGCPVGANMAFLRSALLENPWNKRLLMCEEIHLFMRLRQQGYTFLYVPEMKVQHFISAKRLTKEWLLKRYFDEGIASKHISDGTHWKLRRLVVSTLRLPYAWACSHFGTDQQRLIHQCKRMLYAGALAGLLTFRGTHKTIYISEKTGQN